jgi:hypothetical protein
LVLFKDVLYWAGLGRGYHGGYGLSVPFLRGLLSVPWSQVVIAIERTYDGKRIAASSTETLHRYEMFIRRDALAPQNFSVAPGLWPLGKSYQDKSARFSASDFAQHLRDAMTSTTTYVWIYGFGSAWQSDGPYGQGPTVHDLSNYAQALSEAKRMCKGASK